VRLRPDFELPPQLEAVHRQAVRLEWFSIAYLASAIAVLAAVLGGSQAMKAAWIETSSAAATARLPRRSPPDIVHDGVGNLRTAVHDLMDRRPTTYDHSEPLPLVDDVGDRLRALSWVAGAEVRLREAGHVLVGEAHVVPAGTPADLPELVERTTRAIEELDWRLHDVAVVVLSRLDG
jgi:divalent metal cation (Fe/Co/Zn/Cd) transporter